MKKASTPKPITKRVKRDFLSREAQRLTEDAWYYERPKSIEIIAHIKGSDSMPLKCERLIIPWAILEASYHRYLKTKRAMAAKENA